MRVGGLAHWRRHSVATRASAALLCLVGLFYHENALLVADGLAVVLVSGCLRVADEID